MIMSCYLSLCARPVEEDNVWWSALSFHHKGPKGQPQTIRFWGRRLCPLSHPTSLEAHSLTNASVLSVFLGFMEGGVLVMPGPLRPPEGCCLGCVTADFFRGSGNRRGLVNRRRLGEGQKGTVIFS